MTLTGTQFLRVLEKKRLACEREIAELTGASRTAVMWRARELKNDGVIGGKLVGDTVVYFPPDVAESVEPPRPKHDLLSERDIARETGKMGLVIETIQEHGPAITARTVAQESDEDMTKRTALRNLKKLSDRGLVRPADGKGPHGAQLWDDDGLSDALQDTEIKYESYRNEWRGVRQDVIERDDHACVNCDSEPETFHIHHDPPVWEMSRGDGVLEKSNLHTYCESCHLEHGPWGN
jgi:hypothetical protein